MSHRRTPAPDQLSAFPAVLFVAALAILVAADLLAVRPLQAQVHHLAEHPWHVLAASERGFGAEFSWHHGRHAATGWTTDRLGLTLLLPAGGRGIFFLRQDYVRFDSAERPALSRWPELRPRDPDVSEPEPEWPFESISNGFGRPELGIVTPLQLPLAGPGELGLAAGLPIGSDRLYPHSAAAIPLWLDWRRTFGPVAGIRTGIRIGGEHTFAALGSEFEDMAFPGGWRYGFEAGSAADAGRGLKLGWSARELTGGRHERHLTLDGWLPLTEGHRLSFQAVRALGGKADRHSTWIFGLTWHLAARPADTPPDPTGPRGQNATADGSPAFP